MHNLYSVPSRLIGVTLLVRVRAETLELYLGASHLLTMERLRGSGQHRIDYHHIIDSLVRKPGAFAQYRYRDELFPSLGRKLSGCAVAALCSRRSTWWRSGGPGLEKVTCWRVWAIS